MVAHPKAVERRPPHDFTKQGDIEFWQGKDTSGNLPKLIKQFNDSHPNGKVTFHELPDKRISSGSR